MSFGKVIKTSALMSLFAGASYGASVPGEMIVKLKEGSSQALFSNKSLGVELKREIRLSYGKLFVVKFDQNKNLKDVQQSLSNLPQVEYAEPNYIYNIVKPAESSNPGPLRDLHSMAPNDPQFSQLWGLNNTGSNEPNGSAGIAGTDINAFDAWTITKGDHRVKVAVIDTGIDYNHPDLRENMWVNQAEKNGKPGVDDDGNGYIDDVYGYDFANDDGDPLDGHGHGTHCAGTIGAVHDNGIGVAGVMSDVTFVAVKFLGDNGSGSTEGAIKAIDYATKMNVDIMSNSWGGGGYSEALKEAVERASAAGVVFTAAAGNSSSNNDSSPHYPSNYNVPNVISVAAHTAQDTLAYFSSYGRNTVHIAAPGHKILSTVAGGGYQVFSGTSMATPHVSGAIGLLIAKEGRLSHVDLKERLMATSIPSSALRGKTMNAGRLDAFNLLTNYRPERKEPDANKWKTMAVETWESAHPYLSNTVESRTFSVPGAEFVRLVVRKYDLEKKYDTLTIADGNSRAVEVLSGANDNYVSDYIEGESMTVQFKSDRSVEKWGFVIEEIQWQ